MSWALHSGDCLAGLAAVADGSIDVTITDPPYSAHVHKSVRSGAVGIESRGLRNSDGNVYPSTICRTTDLGFAALTDEVRVAAAQHFARITRRWIAVFSDTESAHLWREALEAAGAEYIRTAFWHKLGGAPQFTGDRPAVALEAITLCHRPGRKRWNGGGKQGLYSVPIVVERGDGTVRVHPTQKPIRLMEQLVADFSDPGETVLDPFAGSGTTGVAAATLGRHFVGWELDVNHHRNALDRLGATRVLSANYQHDARQGVLYPEIKR